MPRFLALLLFLPSLAVASDDPVLAALYKRAGELAQPAAVTACPCGETCKCGANCACPDCPHRVQLTAAKVTPSVMMRPGYELSLLTTGWCEHCPEAKAAADASGVPVTRLDVDREGFRVNELWHGTTYKLAVPAWVLSKDGEAVARWVGKATPGSVRTMAAYVPKSEREGTTGAASARGSARSTAAPVITTRVVLPAMPVVQQQVRSYVPRLSGPSWSEPNSSRQGMIQHLSSGQHGGKFPRAWLESLDYQSLQNLHDNDHNRHPPSASMGGGGYARSAPVIRYMAQPVVMRSGWCPSGNCPR